MFNESSLIPFEDWIKDNDIYARIFVKLISVLLHEEIVKFATAKRCKLYYNHVKL